MSWTDFYRRREAIDLVLRHAGQHRGAGLRSAFLTEVRAEFATEEELALALQYKWSQLLLGRTGVALAEAEGRANVERSDAVASAWRHTAAQAPVLRELLDDYARDAGPAFLAALAAEQRMVAYAAGLVEPGEPAGDVARVGAAFIALIDTTPICPVRRRKPLDQLLRRRLASA